MPAGGVSPSQVEYLHLDLGPSLLQLVVGEIDNRVTSKPADVIATLAFLAGRIVQRSVFRDHPGEFRLDQSANGTSFLRSDQVTGYLTAIKSETLASKLIECTLMTGATRFPDFQSVQLNAQEAMLRRAACYLPTNALSDAPDMLAAEIQTDIDALLIDAGDRQSLMAGIFNACGLAIGYARHKIEPVLGAELAMSIALYAGWLDQRKFGAR
jgi:hypothetical protein